MHGHNQVIIIHLFHFATNLFTESDVTKWVRKREEERRNVQDPEGIIIIYLYSNVILLPMVEKFVRLEMTQHLSRD